MQLQYDGSFILLVVSALLISVLFVFIAKIRNKGQIHFVFLSNITMILIWSIGHILEVVTTISTGSTNMGYVYLYYFGLIFLPVSLLFTGLVFVHTRLKLKWKYGLLFIFPIMNYLVLLTNEYHSLFFIRYSIFNIEHQYGPLFTVHAMVSYLYIVVGLYYLLRFTVINAGFFSKQSALLMTGIIVPLILNALITANIILVPVYYTPIAFSFTIACFSIAILKLDFLNVVPIALQRIVDLISDSYLIVTKEYDIVDFNKAFVDTFSPIFRVRRRDNLLQLLSELPESNIDLDLLDQINQRAIHQRMTQSMEKNIISHDFNKHFMIEMTPIFIGEGYSGTILLFKDITQSKKDLETIQSNQNIIMEQERLASLGQLIGGIAHNLKTPIMSISGAIEGLKDLIEEYDESIGNPVVTPDDHHEIAGEMMEWLEKMKPHCAYMSDIISTVKGQAVQFNTATTTRFTLDELVKRVDLLLKHELKRFHCELKIQFEADRYLEIDGEINSMVQIFDNLIINATQAYEGRKGTIDLRISTKGNDILFAFRDQGRGIPETVRQRLFKEMVTTKGKEGTGLGLYMSYSSVKGRFGGQMWFESEEGEGTTFYIQIPCPNLSHV